jgi:hypothetical protein
VTADKHGVSFRGEELLWNWVEVPVYILLFIFDTRSRYVVQADLKLVILLPQPSEYWGYRCVHRHAQPF